MVSILLGSTLCRYQRSRTFNHSYIIKTLLNINVLKNWMAYALHSRHSWYFFGTKQPQCLPEFWAQKKTVLPGPDCYIIYKNSDLTTSKFSLSWIETLTGRLRPIPVSQVCVLQKDNVWRKRHTTAPQIVTKRANEPRRCISARRKVRSTSYMAITRASEECVLNNAPTVSHMFGPTRAPRPARPADGRQKLRRLRRRTGPVCRSSVPNQGG